MMPCACAANRHRSDSRRRGGRAHSRGTGSRAAGLHEHAGRPELPDPRLRTHPGDVAYDTSLPIKDAQLTVNGAVLAYARSLDVWGRAGKFDAVLPFASLNGTAKVFGQPAERQVVRPWRSAAPVLGAVVRRARTDPGGVRELPGRPHYRHQPGRHIAPGPVRHPQAREHRDPPLVVQARGGGVQDFGAVDAGAGGERHLLHGQRRLLHPSDAPRRSALRGAGPRHLPHPIRRVAGRRRHLLRGRESDGRRRGRRAAGECPSGGHDRHSGQSLQFRQDLRQHRRRRPRRRQLQYDRYRLAISMGGGL